MKTNLYHDSFDQGARRTGTSCIKWDLQKEEFGMDGLLPFTIADADYPACPSVLDAIVRRTNQGVLGYTEPGVEYYSAIQRWCRNRHGWDIDSSWIVPVNGIIPGISYVLEALTAPSDSVVVQTPVYDPFYSVVRACRRTLVENPLIKKMISSCGSKESPGQADEGVMSHAHAEVQSIQYSMNLVQLEQLFSEGARAMILCSPHNPVGRVWTREELAGVARLCIKYQVLLISDEIHWDIILGSIPHTSMGLFHQADLKLIVCTSCSKSFNIAGLQAANFIIPNHELRDRVRQWLDARYLFCPNVLGLTATQASYETGAQWLDDQLAYLRQNADIARDFLQKHLPQVKISLLEGTYLLWMDFTSFGKTSQELTDLFACHGAALGNGLHYGAGHDGFIRMNLACPASQLRMGLECMAKAIKDVTKEAGSLEHHS